MKLSPSLHSERGGVLFQIPDSGREYQFATGFSTKADNPEVLVFVVFLG